jgi:hypothetical protein
MKKILGLLLAGVLLTGCYKDPQSSTTEGNGFQVEFLFEKDGIKMYRFFDGGKHHYFTTTGETINAQHYGKTKYDENIKMNSTDNF